MTPKSTSINILYPTLQRPAELALLRAIHIKSCLPARILPSAAESAPDIVARLLSERLTQKALAKAEPGKLSFATHMIHEAGIEPK